MTSILLVDDDAQLLGMGASTAFFAAVNRACENPEPTRVAFDCEGVNLNRLGSLEIVSLCFEEEADVVFLVDLNSSNKETSHREHRIQALKELFESRTVTKVIHDCRMDCDALYHHFSIELQNVHDTSCFHSVITRKGNKSLNDTLEENGIEVNATRDKSVYKTNPAFWATRPMTDRMKEWAASDVDKLLVLASKQVSILDGRHIEDMDEAHNMSVIYATEVSKMEVNTSLKCKIPIGRFIGSGGSNINRLQQKSGAVIYQYPIPGHKDPDWVVFYPSDSALAMVRRAMGN